MLGGEAADAAHGLGEQQQEQAGGPVGDVELLVVDEVADQGPALVLADDARGEVAADDRRGQWSAVAASAGPEQESADGGAGGVGPSVSQASSWSWVQVARVVSPSCSHSSRRAALRISIRTVSARPWVTSCPAGRLRSRRSGCQFVSLRRILRSSGPAGGGLHEARRWGCEGDRRPSVVTTPARP
ncbi:hypothetical protein BN2537_15429 [Streptomyces venezuelae]|nr:hypothetical protein BN2537_15429 [Streptomyces venezuelae]